MAVLVAYMETKLALLDGKVGCSNVLSTLIRKFANFFRYKLSIISVRLIYKVLENTLLKIAWSYSA